MSGEGSRCARCNRSSFGEETRQRYLECSKAKIERILALVAEDKTDREIADAVGMTPGSLQNYLVRLRKRGYDVPRRSRTGGPKT